MKNVDENIYELVLLSRTDSSFELKLGDFLATTETQAFDKCKKILKNIFKTLVTEDFYIAVARIRQSKAD